MSAPNRPILRYHGGKWALAPWIVQHFPAHRVYVEPFGGGGSVLIRKPRAQCEVYNDLDGGVVSLFRVLRDPASSARLEAALRLTPFAREELVSAYEHSDDPVESARRILVRAALGFGSGGASGRKTGFRSNIRSGVDVAGSWAEIPDVIPAYTRRLSGVTIEQSPAVDVIAGHDTPETLFYVDPPYPFGTRAVSEGKTTVYRHEMSDDDHRALAAVLHAVEGMVVLSGYPCDLYDRELYGEWLRVERSARVENAVGFGGDRSTRTEVLWLNPAASRAAEQPLLDLGAA